MELGSAMTVVMATRLALPVSTTRKLTWHTSSPFLFASKNQLSFEHSPLKSSQRRKCANTFAECIVGATVGVGLCNGDWRSINWRMVAWCYLGWFITLPVTGIISGCLMGIIINAPQWGNALNDAPRLVAAKVAAKVVERMF